MAKVTITIEDTPKGVKVVADPSFEQIMQMSVAGGYLTAAHGYAISALNKIRNDAKSQSNSQIIRVPRIGRV